jgi:hypothetical protein
MIRHFLPDPLAADACAAHDRPQFPVGVRVMDMSNGSYFVGWGTLSLVNAGLAQGKGRSGLTWWLISLLLGPVATFLIVFLDPVAKKTD